MSLDEIIEEIFCKMDETIEIFEMLHKEFPENPPVKIVRKENNVIATIELIK